MNIKIGLFCSFLFVCSSFTHADQTNVFKPAINTLQSYAAPCEEIAVQSDLLKQLDKQINAQSNNKERLIENFWTNIQKQKTPIIENYNSTHQRVIYLYRGAQHNVRLIGGPSNDHEWLTRMKGTDIWFKESIVDTRFIGSYSFAVDSPNIDGYLSEYCPQLNPALKESREQRRSILQVQKLDPFNPDRWFKDEQNIPKTKTTLRNENLVHLRDTKSFVDPRKLEDVSKIKLKKYELASKFLGNTRTIEIYQSPQQYKNQPYITAIFFDGDQYAHLVNVPQILESLVKNGKLPAIQAIFIGHPSDELRAKELSPNSAYEQFFQNELLPWLDQNLADERSPDRTVLLGSSLGGLSSAYLAFKNSKQISHVVPLSGSFWWKQNANQDVNGMSQLIKTSSTERPLHWYFSANSYEYSKQNNGLSILETAPIVARDLRNKGHSVHYQEYVGGHSYAVWQIVLQDALLHFFNKKSH